MKENDMNMSRRVITAHVKKLFDDAKVPKQATKGAAGMDLHAHLRDGSQVKISPGQRRVIGTGLAFALPEGYEGQIRPRSGLAAKQGLTVLNTPGTLDSDFRGELGVILINHGEDTVTINHGDRIAQLVIVELPLVYVNEVNELDDTTRGTEGFGSTGV